jgi:4-amino-4-deoxy-L-arabinose transferase-like glycosyltransferase
VTQKTCSAWAAAVLIAVAAARVASTYAVFSETNDEPMHVSAGLQILEQHRYDYQPANPPLPRLFLAIGPRLLGARLSPEVSKTLYSARYPATLIAARAGNLVFLVLALAAAWAWARREAGDAAALLTVLLLANEPLLLGHAGLATHDAAATAGVALSLWAFARRNPLLLGAAYGFAILCKFSCIAFVPVACAAILLVRRERPRLRDLAVAAAAAAAVICAGYAFFVGRFFEGLASLYDIDRAGMLSYLHGQVRSKGFWDYFPIALGLKTTLPLLALALLALFVPRARPYLAAAAAMLLLTMKSTLDLGARYVLPLYVPLALAAAIAATSARNRIARAVVAALVVAQIAVSIAAHPDYVAYFNALAGRTPSRWLIDSNLEWGQDARRLADTCRTLRVDRLKLSIMSIADLDVLGFPPREVINPGLETRGWIAVGEQSYRVSQASLGGRIWLDALPYRRVGTSIRLYHVP